MVPLFEEHEARLDAGYKLREWEELTPYERALEVAHRRIKNLKGLHENAAAAKAAKRKGRK